MGYGYGKELLVSPILIEGESDFAQGLSITISPKTFMEFLPRDFLTKEADQVQYELEIFATQNRGELDGGFQYRSSSAARLSGISSFATGLQKLIKEEGSAAEFCDEYGFSICVEKCKPRILRSKFMLTTTAGCPSDYWRELSSWQRSDYLKGLGYVAAVDVSFFITLDEIKKLADSLSSLLTMCRDMQSP